MSSRRPAPLRRVCLTHRAAQDQRTVNLIERLNAARVAAAEARLEVAEARLAKAHAEVERPANEERRPARATVWLSKKKTIVEPIARVEHANLLIDDSETESESESESFSPRLGDFGMPVFEDDICFMSPRPRPYVFCAHAEEDDFATIFEPSRTAPPKYIHIVGGVREYRATTSSRPSPALVSMFTYWLNRNYSQNTGRLLNREEVEFWCDARNWPRLDFAYAINPFDLFFGMFGSGCPYVNSNKQLRFYFDAKEQPRLSYPHNQPKSTWDPTQ